MNEELNINELIKVESLPKVMAQLEIISDWIDGCLANLDLDNMVYDEEHKQEIKNTKAEISKTLQVLEDKRKSIKKSIIEPYEIFNERYEELVKSKLQNAENILKENINIIEDNQKLKKEELLREFAEQHFKSREIDGIVKFEDIGLNITISASEKSLKEKIVEFCDRIENDVETILLEEDKNEILLEYKKTLNYTLAKQTVLNRHKELQELANSNKKQEEEKLEQKEFIENVEEIELSIPQEIETTRVMDNEETVIVNFTVSTTIEKMKLLKAFLEENEIEWRN